MKRRVAIGVVLSVGALLVLFQPHRVQTEDMAPSIKPGEWVVLGPLWGLQPGDVVLVDDPAEPGRRVLRRLIAQDQTLTLHGGLLTGARYREMGRGEQRVVMNENDLYLVRTRVREFHEPDIEIEGPGLLLLADDRDGPIDSRWWGCLPESAAQRRVWVRFGAPQDDWRSFFSLRAQDGPWIPPSREALPPEGDGAGQGSG